MQREALETWLGEGLSLEQIGRRVGKHPSTVGYWVKRHGLAAPNKQRHAPRGGIPRETLETLVERDLTIREIAVEVDRSAATVRYWLRRYDLQTTREARLRAKRGRRPGERYPAVCRQHGPVLFVVRGDGRSRCERCRAEAVAERRRRVKRILVAEAGGACAACGYARCLAALQFHHVDPAAKRFSLAGRGVARALAAARAEAAKCVLLCANCHAEVEAGVVDLPR